MPKATITFSGYTRAERRHIAAMASDIREMLRERGETAPKGVKDFALFVARRMGLELGQVVQDPLKIYAKYLASLQPSAMDAAAPPRDLNRLNRPALDLKRLWGANHYRAGTARLMGLHGTSRAVHWRDR